MNEMNTIAVSLVSSFQDSGLVKHRQCSKNIGEWMNFSAGEMFGADEIAVSLVGISQVWNLDKHRQGPNLIGELNKRCKPPKARVPSFHLIPMKFSGFPGWESSRLEPCQTPTLFQVFKFQKKWMRVKLPFLTIRFHPDFAIAKRGEDGALGRRLRRGKQFDSDVITSFGRDQRILFSC